MRCDSQRESYASTAFVADSILLDAALRSCLLHRFVKNEWRVLTSQTIGVEFASKIIKVGTGARRKRIKLQVPLTLPSSLAPRKTRKLTVGVHGYYSYGTRQARSDSDPSRDRTTGARPAQCSSTTSHHTRVFGGCNHF